MDMVKTRSQMLQEGKTFAGIGFQRGFEPFYVYDEIARAGGGLRKFYSRYNQSWLINKLKLVTCSSV